MIYFINKIYIPNGKEFYKIILYDILQTIFSNEYYHRELLFLTNKCSNLEHAVYFLE